MSFSISLAGVASETPIFSIGFRRAMANACPFALFFGQTETKVTSSGALSSGNFLQSVPDFEIKSGGRQCGVKGHAIVLGREGLQIGPDFVGSVPASGRSVSSDQNHVDQAVLHQMSTEVIGDKSMGNPVLAKFPTG